MPTTVAELQAKIGLEGVDTAKKSLKSVGESADSAGKHLSGMGGSLGTLKNAFIGGFGAISGAITGMLGIKVVGDAIDFVKDQVVDLFQQAMSQQAVMAQTAAAIKSTGGAAGISAEQVGDLSDALARQTGISDDTVQSAGNILLTFRAINKDIFPQTTSLVLDMATAMHEDFNSAAIQIGKALQDPIQGVTALRRVGVQLSQQQQDAVKHFMAVGQQAKAQKIIMDELTKEVGGSAAAYGKTFPGMVARFNVSLDQAKEKIGLAVLPVLQSLMSKYLMPLADWFSARLPAAITILTNFLDNQFIPTVNAIMQSPFVQTIEGWAQALAKHLDPAVATSTGKLGDKGLAGASDTAKKSIKKMGGQAHDTGKEMASKDGFIGHMNAGISSVLGLATAIDAPDTPAQPHLTPAMKRATAQFNELDQAQKRQAQTTKSQSIPVISGIGDALGQAGRALGGFVDGIKERFPAAEPQIKRFGDFIGQTFQGVLPGIETAWSGFWSVISTPVKIAFDQVRGIVNVGLDLLGGDLDKAQADTVTMFTNLKNDVLDFGKGIVKMLVGPFQAGLGGISAAVTNFPTVLAPELKKGFELLKQYAIQDITNFGLALLQQMEIWANRIIDAYNNTLGRLPGSPKMQRQIVVQLPSGGGRTPGVGKRASGGPISGLFEGAEDGPELLLKHGLYYSPPGGYVVNARQTQQLLSGQATAQHGGRGGDTFIIYGSDHASAMKIAQEVQAQQRRRQLLTGMGVS